jgi:Zn-dependent oligopeptidase
MADKKICKDMKQLNKLVDLVPQDRKSIAENLVKELSFMAKTLDELKATVEKNGAVDLFKQGVQEFYRESPALKAYNTTIQRYSLLYKQLTDLLPKHEAEPKKNEFYKFMQEG